MAYFATQELEIPEELKKFADPSWSTNKVKIRRLSLPEQLRARDEASKLRIQGNDEEQSVSGTLNQEVLVISTLTKAVVEAPWPVKVTAAYLDFDGVIAQWVFKHVQEFNKVPEEKKNL